MYSHYRESFEKVSGDTKDNLWHQFFKSNQGETEILWTEIIRESDRKILEKMLEALLEPTFITEQKRAKLGITETNTITENITITPKLNIPEKITTPIINKDLSTDMKYTIWFERTWGERLKVNVEVGPIPFENRLKLLNELENQGIQFRQSAKIEGKKYTKVYTQVTDISDWASKQVLVEGMERLYQDPAINTVFKKIALAIESMGIEKEEEQEQVEIQFHHTQQTSSMISEQAFFKFAEANNINGDNYHIQGRFASFLIPTFRELERTFGKTRHKWWWHDSTFTFWFERLKDDRLKLTLELGPLHPEKRLAIIKELEKCGLSFSDKSKQPIARYTRLFSTSKVIELARKTTWACPVEYVRTSWDNEEAIYEEMERMFIDPKNQTILNMIESLIED